jgi:hypothetical protein
VGGKYELNTPLEGYLLSSSEVMSSSPNVTIANGDANCNGVSVAPLILPAASFVDSPGNVAANSSSNQSVMNRLPGNTGTTELEFVSFPLHHLS